MSLEIDWESIVNDVRINTQLREFLNTHIQNLSLPSYLSHLNVTKFSLGSVPPELTIRHVGDPFKEFYESDPQLTPAESDLQFVVELNFQSDLYLELETNLLLNYPSTNFISLPIKLKFTDLFIHSLASITAVNNSKKIFISFLYDIDEDSSNTEDKDLEDSATGTPVVDDQHIHTSRSNSYLGSVPLNYNSSAANFTTSSASTSFLSSLNPGINNQNNSRIDIIKNLKIESEIGQTKDIDGAILRNVGKIEKFLIEMLKDLIITELAWPSWLELDFDDDDDNDDDEQAEEDVESAQ